MFSLKRHYLKLYIFISFLVHHKSFVDMVKIGFHSPKTVTSRCILNNDKSFLYNNDVTESLDHAKTTYMLPLYLISNSAHCEHCSVLWITVALINMVSVLWEYLWLPWKHVTDCRGPACRCFVLYSTSLNIGLIFLNTSVYYVNILKIFNKRLAICIVLPHSYCNIVML